MQRICLQDVWLHVASKGVRMTTSSVRVSPSASTSHGDLQQRRRWSGWTACSTCASRRASNIAPQGPHTLRGMPPAHPTSWPARPSQVISTAAVCQDPKHQLCYDTRT